MGNLYEHIEQLAKNRGFKNITELCRAAGVPRATMSELKMGRSKDISKANAQKIATALCISLDAVYNADSIEKAPTVSGECDILDEIDIAFYGEYKELTDDDKETVRDMVRVMRERRAKKQEQ